MRRERGFTLVEVMVAMVLTAVFFSLIGTILVSFITTQKKVEATLLRERVGSAVLEVLSKDLEQAYVMDIEGAFKGTDERSGSGDADTLSFITTRPPAVLQDEDDPDAPVDPAQQQSSRFSDGDSDGSTFVRRDPPRLSKISYTTADSKGYPGLLTLFRSESRFTPPPPQVSGTAQIDQDQFLAQNQKEPVENFMEVYDRVKSFNVRYLFVDRSQQTQPGTLPPSEWRDAWEETDTTPAALEVTLEIVADPKMQQGEGQDRARKVYRTIIAIPVTQPVKKQTTGPSGGIRTGR